MRRTTKKVIGVDSIFTRCPDCGKIQRVAVSFSKKDEGFETAHHTCGFCGCEMIVEDYRKYDGKGTIVA